MSSAVLVALLCDNSQKTPHWGGPNSCGGSTLVGDWQILPILGTAPKHVHGLAVYSVFFLAKKAFMARDLLTWWPIQIIAE
jgi:hypothetical protein